MAVVAAPQDFQAKVQVLLRRVYGQLANGADDNRMRRFAQQLDDIRTRHKEATDRFDRLAQTDAVATLRTRTASLEERFREGIGAAQEMRTLLITGQASAQLSDAGSRMGSRIHECKQAIEQYLAVATALSDYATALRDVTDIEAELSGLQAMSLPASGAVARSALKGHFEDEL
ncbi:uncharacterized protein MONBRDRAFT_8195 [Monosiga brevicollis MX1]|uniref:Uncharacterized protein n=1 Tax=Monosiga brevicollis TaxID=81824 RepID=A9UZC0_MONBE|nr:uncharacterized protein MONBRDRAFT_8195 [Monosiga brevicollis MX1]EDQ89206.1 predicted protein [Monosiga brevicollis MX1]|eukprot:XP_001745782.1 hypothetical protein [Monosiga brevicollis MX1]